MTAVSKEHIEVTPGTCGGKPRIAGHRIRVQDVVVWHLDHGWSPERIVIEFPQLSLADVYAALAYYHDHRDEIEGYLVDEKRFYEEMKRSQPSLVEKLRRRRNEQTAGHSP